MAIIREPEYSFDQKEKTHAPLRIARSKLSFILYRKIPKRESPVALYLAPKVKEGVQRRFSFRRV